MPGRDMIPFSTEAMRASLLRLEGNGKQCKPAVTGMRFINI